MKREIAFDVAKFIAIFMVVFGHVQTATGMTWGSPYIKNIIIGVNMPFFFVISGNFVRRMNVDGKWRYLFIRISSLLWPALLVSVFFFIVKIIMNPSGDFSPIEWLLGKFSSFWYLWVLCACITISFLIDNCPLKKCRGMCGIAIFAAMMLVPSKCPHVDKTLQMLPYFMIGRYLLKDIIGAIKRSPEIGLISLFAYLLITCFSGNVYNNGMGFYWNHVSYVELFKSSSSIVFWIARMGTAVLGILAMFYAIDGLMRSANVCKLSSFGVSTLGVYILHQDILAFLKPYLSPSPVWVLIVSFLLFIFCHYLVVISKKIKLINTAVWELPKKIIGVSVK